MLQRWHIMPSVLRPWSLTMLNCLPQFTQATVTCSSGSNIMLCWDFLPEEGEEARLWADFEETEAFFLEEDFSALDGFAFLEECRTALREALWRMALAFLERALPLLGLDLLAAFLGLLRLFIKRFFGKWSIYVFWFYAALLKTQASAFFPCLTPYSPPLKSRGEKNNEKVRQSSAKRQKELLFNSAGFTQPLPFPLSVPLCARASS